MAAVATARALMTAGIILGFSPVLGHAGACLLTRLECFSPGAYGQEQDCESTNISRCITPSFHVFLDHKVNPSHWQKFRDRLLLGPMFLPAWNEDTP